MRWLLVFLIACDASEVAGTSDAVVARDTLPECTGTCLTTALNATFMASRTLDVAYYGVNDRTSRSTSKRTKARPPVARREFANARVHADPRQDH